MNDIEIDREIELLEKRKEKLMKLMKLREEISEMEKGEMSGTESKWVMRVIAEETCREFVLSFENIFSKSRQEEVRIPRQIVFFLARKIKEITYSRIGKTFKKDHGTVMHSCRVIQDMIDTDKHFAERIKTLEEKCRAKLDEQ